MLHEDLSDEIGKTRRDALKIVATCDEILTGKFEMKEDGPLEEKINELKDLADILNDIQHVYLEDYVDEEEDKEEGE